MNHRKEIWKLLKANPNGKVLITTHHKPDADALGSSLALFHALNQLGFHSTIWSPTDFPNFLDWMPGRETIKEYEGNETKGIEDIEKSDFIFCLDFNHLSRINEMGSFVEKSKAQIFLIDHHQNPDSFFSMGISNTKASSTCELIYEFIKTNDALVINKDLAQCIYAGMMTDTGGFKYSNTSPNTHRIAADLLELGIDHVFIHDALFDNFSISRSRLIVYSLYKKLEILPEYKTALMFLDSEELKTFNVQTGDTEGLVNFGLGLKNIVFSALIIDRSKMIKMSFRSKGNFPCNEFAKKHFNGGGHINAAGGQSGETLDQVILKFKEVLHEYKNILNQI